MIAMFDNRKTQSVRLVKHESKRLLTQRTLWTDFFYGVIKLSTVDTDKKPR